MTRARAGRRGQSSIENAILIVLAAVALVGMWGHIRSAISGRMKSGADGIGQGLRY
jgi:Flp pilus assembly pilin Flp